MRAAQFDAYGSPDEIIVRRVPIPSPGVGQILVKVRACSVNKGEFALLEGKVRLLSGGRFPKGLGADFAGTVAALGESVADFAVGERVWGLLPGLAMVRSGSPTATAADYVVVDAGDAHRLPDVLGDGEAASLAVVGPTALRAVAAAAIRPTNHVLVRGAAGGVGSLMVQLAKAAQAKVTALAGSHDAALVSSLGADQVFDYRRIGPSDLPRFDVILDAVGSDLLAYRRRLTRGGRMVTVAADPLVGGLAAIAASSIYGQQRIRFSRHDPEARDFQELAAAVDAGRLRATIGRRFVLEDAAAAYRAAQSGKTGGKVIIEISPASDL